MRALTLRAHRTFKGDYMEVKGFLKEVGQETGIIIKSNGSIYIVLNQMNIL